MNSPQLQTPGLRVEDAGDVRVITLDNDAKRNALSAAMCMAIAQAIPTTPGKQGGRRAVLIQGEGKAFCAGADLAGGVYGDDFHEALFAMLRAIVDAPVPVIANVQGPAVGAGTQLALACDLTVVGKRAWFGVPAAKLGFALDAWTINRAKDLLGGAYARGLLLGGARVDAPAALACGFAVRECTDDQAFAYAQEIADQAPLAMQQLKDVLNAKDASYQLDNAQKVLYDACWTSDDAAEARRARAEKRAPNFQGK